MSEQHPGFFDCLRGKTRYIESVLDKYEIRYFEHKLSEILKRHANIPEDIQPFRHYIQSELLYIMLRHLLWIRNDYYLSVLTQFVKSLCRADSTRASEIAGELVTAFSSCFGEHLAASAVFNSDQEFLQYAYVQLLCSGQSAEHAGHPWPDSDFKKKLVQMTRVYRRLACDETGLVISPADPDFMFLKALQSLSGLRLRWLWYLDVLQLRYLLGGLGDQWADFLRDCGQVNLVLEMLAEAGSGKLSAGDFVARWCLRTDRSFHQLDPAELLIVLRDRDLIWIPGSKHGPSKKPGDSALRLTQEGFRLTAVYFSENSKGLIDPASAMAPGLAPCWQLVWVEKALKQNEGLRDILIDLALKCRALPEGMPELIFRELKKEGRVAELEPWVERLCGQSPDAGLKSRLSSMLLGPSMPESCHKLALRIAPQNLSVQGGGTAITPF